MPDFGAILEEHVEDVTINQTLSVDDIDESEDSRELLALEAGRTILENYDDEPVELLDLGESGWAVGGHDHILMMPLNAKPSIMALPEAGDEDDEEDDDDEDDDEMEGKMAYRMKKGEKVGKGVKCPKGEKLYRDKGGMKYMLKDGEKYYFEESTDDVEEQTIHTLVLAPSKIEQFREIAETLGLSEDTDTDIKIGDDGNIEIVLPEAVARQIKTKLGEGAGVRETTSATVGGYAGHGDDSAKNAYKAGGGQVGGKPTPGKPQKNPKKIPSKMEKRWYGDPDVGTTGTVPESEENEEGMAYRKAKDGKRYTKKKMKGMKYQSDDDGMEYYKGKDGKKYYFDETVADELDVLDTLELEEAFTRKHYTAVANILKNSKTVQEAGQKLAAMFAEDNSQFKKSLFLKAAGINESMVPFGATGMPEFEKKRKEYNNNKLDGKGGARFGESEEGGTIARLVFPETLATRFNEAVKGLNEEDKKHKINVGQNGHGNIEVFLPESLARKLEGRLNHDAVTVEV